MKSIVFTFMRCQPPTKAHVMLIDQVLQLAEQHSADHSICISHTLDLVDNPLTWNEKVDIITEVCPDVTIFADITYKTPFTILEHFGNVGYKKVIFVVGGDRCADFTARMIPYVKDWGIEDFSVHNAGDRDPDGKDKYGISNISATRARELVASNNYTGFLECLPAALSEATNRSTFNKLREVITLNTLIGK